MDHTLLILAELAAAICLFYSCRCYVKHFHPTRLTSRRKICYLLLAMAIVFSLPALQAPALALVCNSVLMCYFSFYIGFKIRKHVKHAQMLSEQDCTLAHEEIAKDYRTWYIMLMILLLVFSGAAIILH